MRGPASTERGQDRRAAILGAALRVIGRRGVHATTHRKVAEEAGVSPATTTYYFATLDELLEEALRLFVADEVALLRRATRELAGAHASVEELAGRIAATVTRGDGTLAVAQFELYLEASRRPALRAAARECLTAYEDFARSALEALGSPHAGELAPLFVAMTDGLGLHRAARSDGTGAEHLAAALVALHARTSVPEAAAA